MLNYIKKRLIFNLLSLWAILTITFVIIKVIPGDPFHDESSNMLSQETLQALKAHHGLDHSLFIQYLAYLKSLFTLDLGKSLIYKDRYVSEIICSSFLPSAILGIESLVLSILGGMCLGTIAAMAGKHMQQRVLSFSIFQVSIPSFIFAATIQYIFSIKVPIFPIAFWGNFSHTVLPAISLSITPMAFITQLTCASVSSVLNKDYVLLARSKGLSSIRIIFKHILPYAIFPVISYSAILVTTVMTGTFTIENIFCIPGLGKWFVCSVKQRDYPVIMGLSMFFGTFFILTSLLSDLIQAWIDPQLRRSYCHASPFSIRKFSKPL